MRPKLASRILGALLVLALFGAYTYYHNSFTPTRDDIGAPGQIYEPWTAAGKPLKYPVPWSFDTGVISAAPAEQAPGEQETPAVIEQPSQAEIPAEPEVTPEPTVDPNSPYGQALANAAAKGLPTPPDVDISQWQYVLVNGDHPLDPLDYEPADLVYLNMVGDDTEIRTGYDGNRQVVDALIAQPLIDMTQACKAAGLPVYLSSGYRSYGNQAENFARINANNGITDGRNAEGNYITMPAGCSEHQTGLCIDITDYYHEIKNDSIAQVPTVQWLAENCAEYGFILRFPQEKRDITHVMGESWHFRYVGPEAAAYIMENVLCLEEFLGLYGVA